MKVVAGGVILHHETSHTQQIIMPCRLALHMTTSIEPLKKADVKAALAMKDSQGRRRLLSSVAGKLPALHRYLCSIFAFPCHTPSHTSLQDEMCALVLYHMSTIIHSQKHDSWVSVCNGSI